MSIDQLDLTFPPTVPAVGRYHETPECLSPAALYSLIELSDDELRELRSACESEYVDEANGNVRLAHRTRFVGETLQAIVDYHLEHCHGEEYDPIRFIVAVSKDWNEDGVLLVTLDDDELACQPDKIRLKAKRAGLAVANLQIANMDWEDFKEYDLDGEAQTDDEDDGQGDDSDDSDDSDDEGDSDEDSDDDGDDEDKPTAPDDPGSPEHGPVPPKRNAPEGFYIGVYAIQGVDLKALINAVNFADWGRKRQDFNTRLQAVLPASGDFIANAMALHPRRCETNQWLHKFLFFIADTTDPMENGVLLVSLGGESKHGTLTFPAGATQRFPCDATDAVNLGVVAMDQGIRAWTRDQGPVVAVFFYGPGKESVDAAVSLWDREQEGDRKHEERNPWEQAFVFPPDEECPDDGEPVAIQYSLEEALRRWPGFCYANRFDEKLVRNLFICVDKADVKREGVLIVKVDWNLRGGIKSAKDDDLVGKAEIWRVDGQTAYEKFRGLVDGSVAWEGGRLE
ncbi:hypothetical protein TOPH_02828 [Tolypocladium ophioglossoides CBS 100239]|uniref:DUF6924 domain-containing protein n=1 Tax=Tolypocladium ophioglossoides (strain CBS 100239) TaxID=1163406 RepID=A0A0L0NFJ8_TOLOC|nr:hypothetical protein TOPH_02828 [Tolypocladium ophioglossoides CBS 100239]